MAESNFGNFDNNSSSDITVNNITGSFANLKFHPPGFDMSETPPGPFFTPSFGTMYPPTFRVPHEPKARSSKQPVPDEQKDSKYFRKRQRNNLAAKRSRDARKRREEYNKSYVASLQRENDRIILEKEVLDEGSRRMEIEILEKRRQLRERQATGASHTSDGVSIDNPLSAAVAAASATAPFHQPSLYGGNAAMHGFNFHSLVTPTHYPFSRAHQFNPQFAHPFTAMAFPMTGLQVPRYPVSALTPSPAVPSVKPEEPSPETRPK